METAMQVLAPLMEKALEVFCEAVDREVEAGRLTARDAFSALSGYPDFVDAYEEWIAT